MKQNRTKGKSFNSDIKRLYIMIKNFYQEDINTQWTWILFRRDQEVFVCADRIIRRKREMHYYSWIFQYTSFSNNG